MGDQYGRLATAQQIVEAHSSEKDYLKAFEMLMSLKFKMDNPDISYSLALMYEKGMGIRQDFSLAL